MKFFACVCSLEVTDANYPGMYGELTLCANEKLTYAFEDAHIQYAKPGLGGDFTHSCSWTEMT
jgi:hypothetical protein